MVSIANRRADGLKQPGAEVLCVAQVAVGVGAQLQRQRFVLAQTDATAQAIEAGVGLHQRAGEQATVEGDRENPPGRRYRSDDLAALLVIVVRQRQDRHQKQAGRADNEHQEDEQIALHPVKKRERCTGAGFGIAARSCHEVFLCWFQFWIKLVPTR